MRWVLCAAVALSVSGSFGLHPEPVVPQRPVSAASLQAQVNGQPELSVHVCLVCLLHCAVFMPDAPEILQRLLPAERVARSTSPALVLGATFACHEGRAPPLAV